MNVLFQLQWIGMSEPFSLYALLSQSGLPTIFLQHSLRPKGSIY